jgi:glycosyltransferase involved in cell wall biosynthesis
MTAGPAPLISVLMPAYNHEAYVRFAVDSVLSQTYPNLELIVIDDASRDKTWDILSEYNDPRIRLARHESNQGAHNTLNEAVSIAQGQYLSILNSDDVYHPERLERLLAAVEQSTSPEAWAISDVDFIDSDGKMAAEHPRAIGYRALRDRCAELPSSNWFLTGNPAISTSNFFFSRSLAGKVGLFTPLRYTHDWDWALRANVYAMPVWLNQSLLSYRAHEANTLSEDDEWRHIHENSYIQARALLQLQCQATLGDPWQGVQAACRALLENESLHPLALNLYLACFLGGINEQDMLVRTCAQDSQWFLQKIAEAAALPTAVFRAIGPLAESDNVAASQKLLIEERWNAIQAMNEEIARRDECIAAQTALIGEKDRAVVAQTALVQEKDRAIEAQTALVQEKDRAIEAQTALVREKDIGIAAQTALIEERDRSLDEQSNIIHGLRQENTDQSSRLALLESELADLHNSRVVRVAIRIKSRLARLVRHAQ